jgi:hypothetical protein
MKVKAVEDLTSTIEEYNDLITADHIFIVKGKGLDDNQLTSFIFDLDHIDWYHKLRVADSESQPKIQNDHNCHNWVWGYILSVKSDDLLSFESTSLFDIIKTGYLPKKVDTGLTVKEQNQEMFNMLFEES